MLRCASTRVPDSTSCLFDLSVDTTGVHLPLVLVRVPTPTLSCLAVLLLRNTLRQSFEVGRSPTSHRQLWCPPNILYASMSSTTCCSGTYGSTPPPPPPPSHLAIIPTSAVGPICCATVPHITSTVPRGRQDTRGPFAFVAALSRSPPPHRSLCASTQISSRTLAFTPPFLSKG